MTYEVKAIFFTERITQPNCVVRNDDSADFEMRTHKIDRYTNIQI